MQLTAGRLLQGGKYIINHPLETAGFGITYRGTHTESGQSVVLKTLHPALFKSRAFSRLRDRFVELTTQLIPCQHPHLVRVIELFYEGDWPFMVMEYIHGQSFAELVQPDRPMAEMEALHYIRAIAAGLQISHRQGLVHGNLKPENLIRRAGSNAAVIVGYGISAERMLAGVQYAVPGFPHAFTAPEQIGPTGDRLKSADLYGLAALLYYLLTGQPPLVFDRPAVIAPPERAGLDQRQQLPLLHRIKPSLQPVVRQGLSLNPQDRPASIAAWLQLLPDPHRPQPAPQPTPQPDPQPTIKPAAPPSAAVAERRRDTANATKIPLPQTQIQTSPPIAPPAAPAAPEPVVIAAPTILQTPTPPVERPRFRPAPAPAAPERPRFRQTPLPTAEPVPHRVAAGMSIAPPQVSPTEYEIPPRSPRPYATRPPSPLTDRPSATRAPARGFKLKRWLMLTGGIAAIGGVTFGLVLRFSAQQSPVGGSLFDAEQTFPNRPWDGTLTPSNPDNAPIEDSTSGLPPPPTRNPPPKLNQAFDPAPMIEPTSTQSAPARLPDGKLRPTRQRDPIAPRP